MDTTSKLYTRLFLSFLIGLFIFQSCMDDPSIPDEIFNARTPEVETSSVDSFSATTITVSGVTLKDNGSEVTEREFAGVHLLLYQQLIRFQPEMD